ncbi:unnamed protein product, partial [Closterium sp. Yama58-4]
RAGFQLGAVLLLTFLAVPRVDSVALANSQAQVLLDCQKAWNTTIGGWEIGGDCSKARNVTCDAKGMITSMDLGGAYLLGSFPSSIGNLTSLTHLNLRVNRLWQSSIPESISHLTDLRFLDLHESGAIGNIPTFIGRMSRLTLLDLSYNSLMGTIPESTSELTNLRTLNFGQNRLAGSILPTLSNLQDLTSLNLRSNSFAGNIPASFGSLTNLQSLNLSGNTVTCPADFTPCVIEQNPQSASCSSCLSFCTTCVKAAASAPSPSPRSTTVFTSPPTASLASSPSTATPTSPPGNTSAAAVAGIAVAAVASLLLLVLVSWLLWRRGFKGNPVNGKAATPAKESTDVLQRHSEGLAGSVAASHCTEYSLEEVLTATSNWASDNQLRSGSFGDVYKGVSPRDGTTLWAVKRAKLLEADFLRE